MNVRESIDKIDAGRRAATLVLQRLDLGLDPVAVVRDVAPTLSPLAVVSAARLAGLASFDFACLAIVRPDHAQHGAKLRRNLHRSSLYQGRHPPLGGEVARSSPYT
jgi:hypothetical protein